MGGFQDDPNSNLSEVERFDPIANACRKIALPALARRLHWATLLADGTVPVGGWIGPGADQFPPIAERYFPMAANTFTGTLALAGDWVTSTLVTAVMTGTTPDAALNAMALVTSGGSGQWIAADSNLPVSATIAVSDGLNQPIGLCLRDSNSQTVTAVTGTVNVDRVPPSSTMWPLPATSPPIVALSWSGTDGTSGVDSYDLEARAGDTGPWTRLLSSTTAVSATFPGSVGTTYVFRVRATDAAGNVEAWPATFDVATTIGAPTPTPTITPSPTQSPLPTATPRCPPLSSAAATVNPAPVAPAQVVPGRVLVERSSPRNRMPEAPPAAGPTARLVKRQGNVEVWNVEPGRERELARAFRADPDVLRAEPDYLARLHLAPNDECYAPSQWASKKVGAPAAWDKPTGSSSLIVAVVDGGIDYTHPEFAGRILGGFDFMRNVDDPRDDNGHGTHVAGIIPATGNNGAGIADLAWEVKILPVKVCGWVGQVFGCPTSAVAADIDYARLQGARIINLSLGGATPSGFEQEAITRATSTGIPVIASAGNCGTGEPGCPSVNPVEYPAAFPNVVAVGSTKSDDTWSTFSNHGQYVKLSATGDSIFSTDLNDFGHLGGYGTKSGTSMAAPHVSGVAALVWSRNPSLTAEQVLQILEHTSVDFGTTGRDDYFGFGRIDAAAVTGAMTPSPTASPTPTGSPVDLSTTAPSASATPTVLVGPSGIRRVFVPAVHASRHCGWQGQLERIRDLAGARPQSALCTEDVWPSLRSGQSNGPRVPRSGPPPSRRASVFFAAGMSVAFERTPSYFRGVVDKAGNRSSCDG